ncbi:AraC family transcriptional regulator [Hyphococcus flavus]|uniref:AraC family transcriptional regulator n=1 Tax=Hyphococcus flavus TaxID=1866326 RepID=A0AAE9ZHA9_9PROT|nr:AraC family transcriptional regulator [Hyphococcus flavus]WDI32792.1 AraC family transcriptional regulator [Hyphococcus flavus]
MSPDHFLLVFAIGQTGLLLLMLLAARSRPPGAVYLCGVLASFAGLFWVVLAKDFGWPFLTRLDALLATALAVFTVLHNRALLHGRTQSLRADIVWFTPVMILLAAQPFAARAVTVDLMLVVLIGAMLYCGANLVRHVMRSSADGVAAGGRPAKLSLYAHLAFLCVIALGLTQHLAERFEAQAMSSLWTHATLAGFLGTVALAALAFSASYRVAPTGASRRGSKHSLSPQETARMQEVLTRVMTDDEMFKKPDLQVRDVAMRLGVGADTVSEAIRRGLGANFFDFVNEKRIEDAKQQLVETSGAIEQVMFEAGFNSKSSFYAEFKKRTGVTPGQYRRDSKRV